MSILILDADSSNKSIALSGKNLSVIYLFDKVAEELDVEFIRNGSITLANTQEEVEILDSLVERAKLNGVPVQILDHDDLKKIEPSITDQVIKGLLAPTCGIINPFELVVAAMENAMDNGVKLHLCEEVESINKNDNGFIVATNKNTYETKYVINCAGVNSDKVSEMVNEKYFTLTPRKGEYFVLDHYDNNYLKQNSSNIREPKKENIYYYPGLIITHTPLDMKMKNMMVCFAIQMYQKSFSLDYMF